MATDKQIEANRRNAKKSTGPRTEEGKAKSAQNARKHGLTSRRMVLADEDAAEFEQLWRNVHRELNPETQLEVLIVNRIAAVQWRLARVPALEAELMDRLRYDMLGEDHGLGGAWSLDAGPYGGALARLARYETALERNAARLMAELRRSQGHRWQRQHAELAELRAERDCDYRLWRGDATGWPGDDAGPAKTPAATQPPALPSGEGGLGDEVAPVPSRADGAATQPPALPSGACPEPSPREGDLGDEVSALRNEATPAPLLRQRAPQDSPLQAHVSGAAFRAPSPALHRLNPTRRPTDPPTGRG